MSYQITHEQLEEIEHVEAMSDRFYHETKSTEHLSVSVGLFSIKTHLLYHMNYEQVDDGMSCGIDVALEKQGEKEQC
jgi:hypothetical protein